MSRQFTITNPSGITLKTKNKYMDDDVAISLSEAENILASNIKKDISILGVSGTYEGFIPSGSVTISENGTYNVSAFAEAVVSVPGLVPSGILEISGNGVYDVGTYASANVNVPTLDTATEILNGNCSVLNNSCSKIVDYFFTSYPNLREINLPNCTEVGRSCFYMCQNLSTINIPNLSSVGYAAFAYCSSITTLSTNASQISFSIFTFSRCSSLTAIYTPNATSVYVEGSAFAYCSSLEEVSFLSTGALVSIGAYAFAGCTKISCPIILNTPYSSCSIAFNQNNFPYISITVQNSSLQAVSLSILNNSAFTFFSVDMTNAHPEYRAVYINDMRGTNIQKVDDSCAFATSGIHPVVGWNYSRVFMSTPISLFSLSIVQAYSFTSYMFSDCTSLKNVLIKSNKATQLGAQVGAFRGCTNLEMFIASGKTGGIYYTGAFANCYKLSYYYVYNGCYGSGTSIFENCYNLKSIMGFFGFVASAFKNCSSLESIYLMQDYYSWNIVFPLATLANSNALDGTPIADSSILGYFGSIYVPASQYDRYISATNWVFFSERFVSLTSEEEAAAKKAYKDGGGLSSIWSY